MRNSFNPRGAAAIAAGAALLMGTAPLRAADHRETPTTTADAVADIADVYTWYENGRFTIVMTADGIRMPEPGQAARFDEDVRYELHIGRDDFATTRAAAVDIVVRIKQENGQWTVSAQGIPGAGGTVRGNTESVISKGSANVFVGLRDDPFFFDLEGFRNTLMTGTLMFNPARDTFAGMNATAIVVEMDLNAVKSGSDRLYVWGTTARKDG